MDAMKGLKYALVMVLVTSAILLGWTTYIERRLDHKLADFSNAVMQAKSEAEAKQVIQGFLTETGRRPVASSASADSQTCDWLCK